MTKGLITQTALMACVAAAAVAAVPAAVKAPQAQRGSGVVVSDGKGDQVYGTVAVAPTEDEAKAAFRTAREQYMAVAAGGSANPQGAAEDNDSGTLTVPVAGGGELSNKHVRLEDVRLVMDLEDISLKDVLRQVVSQAAAYTGPWTVKWRLQPENRDIVDERVNLTAQAPFGEFCNLLTERVKNMTGTQLFVTAFDSSRVILVTDSYY
ncbi:MAG: hypothetical protein GC129_06405 [Proteobacteria bacterium]|nr:hypothetical protein [Pseudomonadota bacterium]